MRGRTNTLLLALCIALAITVAVQTFSPFNSAPHDQAANAAAQGGQEQQSYVAAFWKWTTHDPVAFYTSVLALFTGVLGASTIGLWLQTRKAADAAKLAAEHIPRVERAYLFFSPVNVRVSLRGVDRFGKAVIDGPTTWDFMVVNQGKTPAMLTKVYLESGLTLPPSETPVYENGILHNFDMAVRAGYQFERFPVHYKSEHTVPHYFWGYMQYADIFKVVHTVRVCAKIYPVEGRFELTGRPAWNDWD